MSGPLQDGTGFRGEKIIELCLTDYKDFARPLFRPGFLGDKWPVIDFLVELTTTRGQRPYFFGQVKSTASALTAQAENLTITAEKRDIALLLRIPGPTYLLGVHEPSKRVFVRSVHAGIPIKAITRIPLEYELHSRNLKKLYDEVRVFWMANDHKPTSSVFT